MAKESYVIFRDGAGCVVCLRQGKLMENHFVCVSQPPVFQGHKTRPYSYIMSSLTL